ncbi:MAG TPA: DUF4870 domain-containing protein [Puia sp.]|nr:DUF4870 domain-containing protein [Puia sp.]
MSEERLLAILAHILAIVPGIGILGPLIIYLVKKDESPFVRDNARESLNFQLTIILLYIISGILVLIFIGLFLIWIVGILNTILVIVASVRALEGQVYRYPISLRLI